MGIFGALQSAVSGLKAQSHAMENISGNIANSQTIGYKRIDTSFVDMLQEAPVKQQIAGAVSAFSRATNTLRGDVQNSDISTHIALNSNGFFVVEPALGGVAGDYFTRRGDFEQDREGFLTNGAGFRLKGYPMEDGAIVGSTPTAIKVDNSFMGAKDTTSIDYRLNLPEVPRTAAYAADSTDPDNALFPATAPTTPDDFNKATVSGGSITVYSETGQPIAVNLRWAKIANADLAATPPTADQWKLFYQSKSEPATGETGWSEIATYDFSGGQMTGIVEATTTPPSSSDLTIGQVVIGALTVNGVTLDNNGNGISLNHGKKGLTQYADNSGAVTTNAIEQNGFAAGEFISVGINDQGQVVASYTNGKTKEVAQIVVANFANANALIRGDGGTYRASTESGQPIISSDGAGIVGSSTEASNTDISEEFTKLIVTQQAYSANTRIVSAADEMLKEALSMIR